jgi:L-asparaginase
MGARFPLTAALLLTFALAGWSVHAQTVQTAATSTVPAAPQAATPDLPRVRLVATGGTISNKNGGRLTAEELVNLMPNVGRYARPECEQFSNLASSQLTLDQWVALSKRINQLFKEDPGVGGIVVTSGTDTLEELAYFLDLTVRSAKPVVVVGSMRNPSTLGYEGAANLLEAFRVAAEPSARSRGVMVVLNDEINAAREVTKTDALRLNTFQTRGYGILGVVDSDRVMFYRKVEKKHTADSEFDINTIASLPRVDVILTYQGATGDLIKAAVDQGAKGIIIAGAGAGATSGTQGEGMAYALEKGVFVVTTTRTGSGRIAAQQRPANALPPPAGQRTRSDRAIAGEDLAPIKARLLLMLALTKTQDGAEVQRMFIEY